MATQEHYRSNNSLKLVAQRNSHNVGSYHAPNARPSQHFVQTIPAMTRRQLCSEHSMRHWLDAARSDLSGSGWNHAKALVPSSHCGKFHFAHHGTRKSITEATTASSSSLRATVITLAHTMLRMHGLHNTSFRPSQQ